MLLPWQFCARFYFFLRPLEGCRSLNKRKFNGITTMVLIRCSVAAQSQAEPEPCEIFNRLYPSAAVLRSDWLQMSPVASLPAFGWLLFQNLTSTGNQHWFQLSPAAGWCTILLITCQSLALIYSNVSYFPSGWSGCFSLAVAVRCFGPHLHCVFVP